MGFWNRARAAHPVCISFPIPKHALTAVRAWPVRLRFSGGHGAVARCATNFRNPLVVSASPKLHVPPQTINASAMKTGYDRSGFWGFDITCPIYKGTRSAKAFTEVRANHSVGTRCTCAFCCTLYKCVGIVHSTEPSYAPSSRARLRI